MTAEVLKKLEEVDKRISASDPVNFHLVACFRLDFTQPLAPYGLRME